MRRCLTQLETGLESVNLEGFQLICLHLSMNSIRIHYNFVIYGFSLERFRWKMTFLGMRSQNWLYTWCCRRVIYAI